MAIDRNSEPDTRSLSVGQLAARAGVRADTIRYYERAGLLPEPDRTDGDHRRYGPADLDRMLFIRGARRLGLRLLISPTGPAPRRQGGTRQVRSDTVLDPVIRMAEAADVPALAALRRAWTAENGGDAADEGFEARFADWYERESARRISWLAEVPGDLVGMMNLAVFERMPVPGRDAGTWGYLANAFVLRQYRGQGIGGRLLSALLAHADDHGYVRVVLSPSARSIPFYNRAGFTANNGLLVRRGTR